MALTTRAAVLRRAASLFYCLPLVPLAPMLPALAADGLDAALKPCPDTRIVCFSSFDPTHFLEAWEYDGSRAAAVESMASELTRLGGVVDKPEISKRGTALYAKFTDKDNGKTDNSVIWFPSDDNLIHFRSERVDEAVWDGNANKLRLLEVKKDLKLIDRVRELGVADLELVGRNAAGQIVAEREAME